MELIRIIIIEDEKPAARSLERKIEKLGYKVEHKLGSVEEAVHWFQSNPAPDLIFLDIQLSDGLSFEIFEQVQIKSAIIFTTAYDAYALRAFKLNSIDYLLKPIVEEELRQAIEKFLEHRASFFDFNEQLNLFQKFLSSSNKEEFKERFSVKIGSQIKIVLVRDIVCFYSENKGSYIYTKENRSYVVDYTLEELEQIINPNVYFRMNRKFIIALEAIKEIYTFSNSRLKVNLINYDSDELIVSREKVNDFKKWLEK